MVSPMKRVWVVADARAFGADQGAEIGRQLVASEGAALSHTRIAFSGIGFGPGIDRLLRRAAAKNRRRSGPSTRA